MATLRRGVDSVCTVPTVLATGASRPTDPKIQDLDPPPGAPGRSPLPALLLRVSSLGALASRSVSLGSWLASTKWPANFRISPFLFGMSRPRYMQYVPPQHSVWPERGKEGTSGPSLSPFLGRPIPSSESPSGAAHSLSLCFRSCLALDRSPSSPSSHHQHTLSSPSTTPTSPISRRHLDSPF